MSGSPGRQQFLADIIAELSRQKLEDAAAFEGVQKVPASALFRKLCFDFPSITDPELEQVYTAMRGLLVPSTGSPVEGDFKRAFYFNEKFLENIGYLCNTESTTATETNAGGQAIYKMAVAQFLASPAYLLCCPHSELSQLLSCDGEPLVSWKSILERFHRVVHLSSVSTIASHASINSSPAVLPVLQEGALIAALCKAIDLLGKWVVRTERQLSRRADEEDWTAEDASAGDTVSSGAALALEMLDSMGSVGDKSGRFCKAQSLFAVLEAVLDASAPGGGDSRRSLALLDTVLRVIKPCWLHMSLFLRDVYVQFPQLLPAQAGALLSVLDQRVVDFGRKSDEFPSAVECMYVVVLTSLCASVRVDSGASSTVAHTVACLHGKNALRAYLEAPSTLAQLVEICARMAADGIINKSVKSVNIESVGFLIDAAVPFTCDPARLSVSTPTRLASSSVAPTSVIISSGMLPALLMDFLTLLEQQTLAGRAQPSQQTTLLADRLVRCVSLLVLPASSPSMSGIAVLRYTLDFPELVLRLLALSACWQSASAASEGFVPMAVFSEAQALGLVSALLLGQLNTLLHPGGAALAVRAETQEALLTALTRGCTAVKAALRQLVSLYRDAPAVAVVAVPPPMADETSPAVSDTAETGVPEGSEDSTAGEQSTPSPPPTEADAALLRAKKLRASQLNSALQYLASLTHTLILLAGEGACAPILRAVCAATGWKNANSTSTLCVIVQAVLVGLVNDALATVNDGLQLLRSRDTASDSDDKTAKASAIGKGSLSAAGHMEEIKKQLKALQGLLTGGTSSKSD